MGIHYENKVTKLYLPKKFVHSLNSNDLNTFWSDHTDIIYSYNYCLIRHSCIKRTIKQGDL